MPFPNVLALLFQLYFFTLPFRLQFGLKFIRNIVNCSLDVVSNFRNNMNKREDVLE